MDKICTCGKTFFVKTYLLERKKYCCKACFYKYHGRKSGLKYNIIKENPTWFKKDSSPWNKGLILDEKSSSWAGDRITKDALHDWVERRLGKPQKCQNCLSSKKQIYEWSNISGQYKRELSDWQRLCKSCHFHYDREQFGSRANFHR